MGDWPIKIELAGPPRGKGRPRFVRETGRTYTPAKTASYEGALKFAAQRVMGHRPPLDDALDVLFLAVFPIPASWSKKKRAAALAGEIRPATKPDADNILKVSDALNEVVWRDDKQIVEATIQKFYGSRPRLVIEVTPLSAISEAAA